MKRNLVVIFIFHLFISAVSAQNNLVYEPVVLSLDKIDGQYKRTEKVNVYGTLTEDITSDLVYEVKVNGQIFQKATPIKLTKGERTIVHSASWDQASAVQVYVYPSDNSEKKAAVGYVVNPEKFRPGFRAPRDFRSFWDKELRMLRKSELEGSITPVTISTKLNINEEQCELYAVKVNMHEGNPVHGYISWPKDAAPGTLPIVICLHGAGVSRSDAAKAVEWASKGVIAIDINAHGYPDDQPLSYYDSLKTGELKDYRNRKITDHKSFYFRLMYLRAVRALDYASTLPLWDGKRIMSVGGSQGGAQAIAVAAIDKRVGAVHAHVPAMTDIAGHLAGHRGGWPYYASQMKTGDNLDAEMSVLPYYDGAIMLQHTTAKLWIESGLIDNVCSPECVISAFNVAVSKDKTLYTFPYRPHSDSKIDLRFRDDWKAMIDDRRMEEILEWLK